MRVPDIWVGVLQGSCLCPAVVYCFVCDRSKRRHESREKGLLSDDSDRFLCRRILFLVRGCANILNELAIVQVLCHQWLYPVQKPDKARVQQLRQVGEEWPRRFLVIPMSWRHTLASCDCGYTAASAWSLREGLWPASCFGPQDCAELT